MPKKKVARKYAKPKSIVEGGFRRVTKSELRKLGYSERSALYTKADVKNPTKFVTRADIRKVQQPLLDAELADVPFHKLKRERIRSLRKKRFKHTYTIYSDYKNFITLEQAIVLTKNFFEFLKKKHKPQGMNTIGLIYNGVDDDFSIQPRYWADRDFVIEELTKMVKKYKKKIQIIFITGWIEQAT